MTAVRDVDASVVGQANPSPQNPPFNSRTPTAEPSHSTTIPRDTVKRNQPDEEQSGVKREHEAGVNKKNQTHDEQSEVRDDNEAVENKNSQTDNEQSGITIGHEAAANKPVWQFTVIEQQDFLGFPHSIAHYNSADFKLGAGLAEQIKEKFLRYFSTKKEYKQQVLLA